MHRPTQLNAIANLVEEGDLHAAGAELARELEAEFRVGLRAVAASLSGQERLQFNQLELEIGGSEKGLEDFKFDELGELMQRSGVLDSRSPSDEDAGRALKMFNLEYIVEVWRHIVEHHEGPSLGEAKVLLAFLEVMALTFTQTESQEFENGRPQPQSRMTNMGLPQSQFRELEESEFPALSRAHSSQTDMATKLELPVAVSHEHTGMRFILIPGGRCVIGPGEDDREARDEEGPRCEVEVEPFYLGIAPVTQAQWQGTNPSAYVGVNRPVERLTWKEVVEFLDGSNSEHKGLFRLPSETEWEFAARGFTDTTYWWGDVWDIGLANCREERIHQTSDVGKYPPNPFGLLDILGNVWELCADEWQRRRSEEYSQAPPSMNLDAVRRVGRGGSWSVKSRFIRVTARQQIDGGKPSADVGLRCVANVDRVRALVSR